MFDLFDEIILLSEGQILYQGPHEEVMPYFNSLGYRCPDNMDIADFLQIIPTNDGRLYLLNAVATPVDIQHPKLDQSLEINTLVPSEIVDETKKDESSINRVIGIEKNSTLHRDNQIITYEAHGTEALVNAWENSALFVNMMNEINDTTNIIKSEKEVSATQLWPEDMNVKYPGTLMYHFKLTLHRQYLILMRDKEYILSDIFQNILMGAVAGSLFNNIPTENTQSMSGFLFFSALYGGLSSFSIIPGVYSQKSVYKKHYDAFFYPTEVFTLSQAVVFYPLQIIGVILVGTIMYWSAGLCSEGGRFLTYLLITLVTTICLAQFFRTICYYSATQDTANSVCALLLIPFILFSGFILPPAQIPDWWIWFYYINPVAYCLKAVFINEYTCPRYDFSFSTSPGTSQRFGDYVLSTSGYDLLY